MKKIIYLVLGLVLTITLISIVGYTLYNSNVKTQTSNTNKNTNLIVDAKNSKESNNSTDEVEYRFYISKHIEFGQLTDDDKKKEEEYKKQTLESIKNINGVKNISTDNVNVSMQLVKIDKNLEQEVVNKTKNMENISFLKKKEWQITIALKIDCSDEQRNNIEAELKKISYIKNYTYKSQEQMMDEFINNNSKDIIRDPEKTRKEMRLPAIYVINLNEDKNYEQIKNIFKQMSGVDYVFQQGEK